MKADNLSFVIISGDATRMHDGVMSNSAIVDDESGLHPTPSQKKECTA